MAEEIKLRPETEKFWSNIKKKARKYQFYIQNRAEGKESNVFEDAELEEEWLRFQLVEDPEDQPL